MSVNSKMTALADEIRELSGTEETMGLDAMTNYVDEANTEVNTQADLIAQIKSTVDNLPEASSGSGTTELKNTYVCHPYSYFCLNIVFEEGWTWEDYYNSKYNILYSSDGVQCSLLGIQDDESYVFHVRSSLWYISIDGTKTGKVLKTDKIIESTRYLIYDDE